MVLIAHLVLLRALTSFDKEQIHVENKSEFNDSNLNIPLERQNWLRNFEDTERKVKSLLKLKFN